MFEHLVIWEFIKILPGGGGTFWLADSRNHNRQLALSTEHDETVNSYGQPQSVRVNRLAAVLGQELVGCAKKNIWAGCFTNARKQLVSAFEQQKIRRLRGQHTTTRSSSRPLDYVFKFQLLGCHLHNRISPGWAWLGSGRTSIGSKVNRRVHECAVCYVFLAVNK